MKHFFLLCHQLHIVYITRALITRALTGGQRATVCRRRLGRQEPRESNSVLSKCGRDILKSIEWRFGNRGLFFWGTRDKRNALRFLCFLKRLRSDDWSYETFVHSAVLNSELQGNLVTSDRLTTSCWDSPWPGEENWPGQTIMVSLFPKFSCSYSTCWFKDRWSVLIWLSCMLLKCLNKYLAWI